MKNIVKSLSIIAAVAAIVVGGTGAWWSRTASSNNSSSISGTMDLKVANSYGDNLSSSVNGTWNQNNMEPGGTPLEAALYMKNIGSIDAHHMSFAVTKLTGDTGMAKQMRITKLDYGPYGEDGESLLTGGAGADLSNYVAPTYCDVTVDPSVTALDTIHEGIAVAITAGDVVCVKPGTYTSDWETSHSDSSNYPVIIDKNITLVSLDGPDTTTITVSNVKNAIEITSDNVTVKGFTITGANRGIDTGGHTGIIIQDNIISNYGGQSGAEGILVDGGNVNIINNKIEANATPNPEYSIDSIYIKGGATVTVTHNDLSNNQYGPNAYNPSTQNWSTAAGLSLHDGCNVTATYNAIHNNDFGVHVKNANATIVANYNDISGNSRDFFFEAPSDGCPSTPFNFKNNWWGDFNPADHITGNIAGCTNGMSDVIDYTNFAGGPFIGYINGVNGNDNHFADLRDFYDQRAQGLNVNSGLNHNQWGKLNMAVQLDGPTTGDDFQGKTFGMDMTVNMSQQH